MLLTLTLTRPPATDLGFLLHKNPDRVQQFALPFGVAHVFYPEASEERCTAALLLDVDPVGLVRGAASGSLAARAVRQRPAVRRLVVPERGDRAGVRHGAGRQVARTRPELAEQPLPLEARIAVAAVSRAARRSLRRLFEPLGYARRRQCGTRSTSSSRSGAQSRYFTVAAERRRAAARPADAPLRAVPVLDDEKHYWVGDDEVEKLLRARRGLAAAHPERELIASRYLKHQRTWRARRWRSCSTDEEPDADDDDSRAARGRGGGGRGAAAA